MNRSAIYGLIPILLVLVEAVCAGTLHGKRDELLALYKGAVVTAPQVNVFHKEFGSGGFAAFTLVDEVVCRYISILPGQTKKTASISEGS